MHAINTYRKLSREKLTAADLARLMKQFEADLAAATHRDDRPASALAKKFLTATSLRLAATPATTRRQILEKEDLIAPNRLRAAGFGDAFIDITRAGIVIDHANLRVLDEAAIVRNAPTVVLPQRLALYAKSLVWTFEEVLGDHAALRRHHADLLAKRRLNEASFAAALTHIEAVRPAARPARHRLEAEAKLAFIDRCDRSLPCVAAMLDAATVYERDRWGITAGEKPMSDDLGHLSLDFGALPLTAEFLEWCRGFSLTTFLKASDTSFADAVTLMRQGSDLKAGCLNKIVDYTLYAAASDAPDRETASLKMEKLNTIMWMPDEQPEHSIAMAMLKAAFATECRAWPVDLLPFPGV